MRRLSAVATFLLLLAPAFVWAQRGGHASAGGHGGFGARGGMIGHSMIGHSMTGHSMSGRGIAGRNSGVHVGGGHAMGGMRSGPRVAPRGFSHGTFRQPMHSRGFQHFRNPRIRNFRNCFNCRRRFINPWGYAGLYDPYWWWDSGSSYDQDYERDRAYAEQINQQSLDEQRARREDDQDSYARSDPQPQPRREEHAETLPATVLVFRDQRKQEVENYAIVGQTLWAFAPQRTQKIPLSDLDIPATTKANDERGVDFRVPSWSEGQ